MSWRPLSDKQCSDGQVIELWSQFDDLGLLQQLGIVPRPDDAQAAA
jgi:hypothetical protein